MAILNLFKFVKDQVEFASGDVILTEDEPGTVMYVVLEGEVDVTHRGKYIETVKAGSIVGELALIDNHAHSATAIAKTDCKLAPIDRQSFTFMVSETPFFALEVMKIMADRLRRVRDQD
ncbi:MAG: cyclic nucleotide-binding domain-containing protein [Anaerolineae bacterium]